MKNLRTTALCVCAMLYSICSFAQQGKAPVNEPNQNKPRLFDNLPERIPVTIDDLDQLLTAEVGRKTSLRSSNSNTVHFDGEVVSATSKYNNTMNSVVMRSSNFNGATFSLTKTISADGTVSFVGRIISFQHSDIYELQNQSGQLTLVKRNFYDLINE